MLQTSSFATYKESREYAIHQARTLRTGKETNNQPVVDLGLNESKVRVKWHSKTDRAHPMRLHPNNGRPGCNKWENTKRWLIERNGIHQLEIDITVGFPDNA